MTWLYVPSCYFSITSRRHITLHSSILADKTVNRISRVSLISWPSPTTWIMKSIENTSFEHDRIIRCGVPVRLMGSSNLETFSWKERALDYFDESGRSSQQIYFGRKLQVHLFLSGLESAVRL
jgi:hypothetical protein